MRSVNLTHGVCTPRQTYLPHQPGPGRLPCPRAGAVTEQIHLRLHTEVPWTKPKSKAVSVPVPPPPQTLSAPKTRKYGRENAYF